MKCSNIEFFITYGKSVVAFNSYYLLLLPHFGKIFVSLYFCVLGMFSAGGQLIPMAIPLGAPRTIGCLETPVTMPVVVPQPQLPKQRDKKPSPIKRDIAMQVEQETEEKQTEIKKDDFSEEVCLLIFKKLSLKDKSVHY